MAQKGKVKWFNADRVTASSRRTLAAPMFRTLFRHQGRGYRSLNEGQEVEFEVKDGRKDLKRPKFARSKSGNPNFRQPG